MSIRLQADVLVMESRYALLRVTVRLLDGLNLTPAEAGYIASLDNDEDFAGAVLERLLRFTTPGVSSRPPPSEIFPTYLPLVVRLTEVLGYGPTGAAQILALRDDDVFIDVIANRLLYVMEAAMKRSPARVVCRSKSPRD